MSHLTGFRHLFKTLTGNTPFPWQEEMYRQIVDGALPPSCSLPTGLGKTSVIAIWLIALADNPSKVPRRLVYIVNRRTVVDQATEETRRIRDHLVAKNGSDSVMDMANRLAQLAANPDAGPLAISTLRGQFADNGEWRSDPARAAVVVGTIDMIGSRLLFSGYGSGYKSRPLHAGFLGQDTLIVHDEAHLEPAFQDLLAAIETEQQQNQDVRRLRVMELTATSRSKKEQFGLTSRDLQDPVVQKRIGARKAIEFHPLDDEKKAINRIADLALKHKDSGQAILLFLRKLDDVKRVADVLRKAKMPVEQLTGTLRGKERDELVTRPVFQRFLPPSQDGEMQTPAEGTVYLVCTSAGEVGVNISADHLVCDLAPFDSMAQRFGRVNRFGDGDAQIDVVYPEQFDKNHELTPPRQATLALLQELNGDASPRALDALDPTARLKAFAPEPTILPATDILFDAWAMTTIRGQLPGRPPVEPYLHGIAEWEPPETHVAWRHEVEIITDELLDRYPPSELLEDYPLKPHELLRDQSSRVFDELQVIAGRHPTKPVWVVDEQGKVATFTLGELADPSVTKSAAKKSLLAHIEGRTILLPPSVGGLSCGMLDGKSELADDVANIEAPETERRIRRWSNEEKGEDITGMRLVRSIDFNQAEEDEDEQRTWNWYKSKPLEDSRVAQKPVLWATHVNDVVRHMNGILAGLSLPADLAQAVRVAGRLHDYGKRRLQSQLAMGNREYPRVVLAKSGRAGAKLPETWRHEFGSLADAQEDVEFQQLSPEMQDVVLHLIAAHHGRARPHFPADEVFAPAPGKTQTDADRLASEVPRRFARLQRRYGRWGLAYLESLLRAADWAASANPSEFATESREVPQ